jgi:RNA polymerase sigma-70 factor, ECF subfamily
VEESEPDIVRRAIQGDESAFSRLYQRYSRPLMRFLYGMAGGRESAEDLMQETISRAFSHLHKLRDEAMFSTWLFGIARNVALENCRRRISGSGHLGLDHRQVKTLSVAKADPEADAIKRQLYQAVNRGLNALDEDLKAVFALRVFAEMKYQEIAEITGWSLPKVKIEIHRARIKMRKALEPHLGSRGSNDAM